MTADQLSVDLEISSSCLRRDGDLRGVRPIFRIRLRLQACSIEFISYRLESLRLPQRMVAQWESVGQRFQQQSSSCPSALTGPTRLFPSRLRVPRRTVSAIGGKTGDRFFTAVIVANQELFSSRIDSSTVFGVGIMYDPDCKHVVWHSGNHPSVARQLAQQ